MAFGIIVNVSQVCTTGKCDSLLRHLVAFRQNIMVWTVAEAIQCHISGKMF